MQVINRIKSHTNILLLSNQSMKHFSKRVKDSHLLVVNRFNLATRLVILAFFLAASFGAKPNCTISGNVNSSANPFAGCSGVITITGTLFINGDYNVTSLGAVNIVLD